MMNKGFKVIEELLRELLKVIEFFLVLKELELQVVSLGNGEYML